MTFITISPIPRAEYVGAKRAPEPSKLHPKNSSFFGLLHENDGNNQQDNGRKYLDNPK